MKKTILFTLLLAACLLPLAGCTTTTETTTTTAAATTTSTSSVTTTTGGTAASWQIVGPAGFSSTAATECSLYVYGGTPYVAYRTTGDKVAVKKFNGTSWVSLGADGLTAPYAAYSFYPSLWIADSSHIYLAMASANGSWSRVDDFVLKYNTAADSWEAYGAAYTSGGAENVSLSGDSAGVPYVAYVPQGGIQGTRACVSKYNTGTQVWDLTQSGMPKAMFTSLQIVNDLPWLAYRNNDTNLMGPSVVSWETGSGLFTLVGSNNFTPDGTIEAVKEVSLAVDNNTPYVAFTYYTGTHNQQGEVWKYNGSSWSRLGSAPISSGIAGSTSLSVYNHTPYVAYSDSVNSGKATLKYFNGTSWVEIGSGGFSPDAATYTSLFIAGGVPYVAFRDANQSYKVTVMKYQ
jgi:hypothetical protein